MSRNPDFEELVGADLPADDAARLRRVHEMLLAAGPPPELPPSLAEPPGKKRKKNVSYLPRRRVGAALLLAAAFAVAFFGAGYFVGGHGSGFDKQFEIPMHGTASSARASLALASPDRAGNRPIEMVVRGLPDLGEKGYYELFLTRAGKRAASCGTFVVHGHGATAVRLNAPYVLGPQSRPGWIVVSHLRGSTAQPTLLTT